MRAFCWLPFRWRDGKFQIHGRRQIPQAGICIARDGFAGRRADLQRHFHYQRVVFEIYVQGKRADAQDVSVGQSFVLLQWLAIEHDRVRGPQIANVVFAFRRGNACVQTRH